jgi:iron complex transport system permease protein
VNVPANKSTSAQRAAHAWLLGAPLLYLLPIVLVVCTLFIGRYPIAFGDTINALLAVVDLNWKSTTREVFTLITQVRLPRAVAAAFVGASLSASGAAFQGVFRNPLVNSGLLGVDHGAGFGAALAIVAFAGGWSIYPSAFTFGVLAVCLSYGIGRIYRTTPVIMLILGGVIVSSVFSALISLLKFVADPDTQLPSIVYWLMGSLSSVEYASFWALIPMTLGLVLLLVMSWRINVLSMGDREAHAMGLDVRRDKGLLIVGATLATAGAVCLSGIVGWVGLVIPHVGRMIVGNDNRRLIPVSMAIGAAFMVVIDTVSRSFWASEVPLGVLTALVGAPFFVYLLKKTKGGGW